MRQEIWRGGRGAGLGCRTALIGSHIRAEAADALYHYLVLLQACNLPVSEVLAELDDRMNQSGLDEKASRKRP